MSGRNVATPKLWLHHIFSVEGASWGRSLEDRWAPSYTMTQLAPNFASQLKALEVRSFERGRLAGCQLSGPSFGIISGQAHWHFLKLLMSRSFTTIYYVHSVKKSKPLADFFILKLCGQSYPSAFSAILGQVWPARLVHSLVCLLLCKRERVWLRQPIQEVRIAIYCKVITLCNNLTMYLILLIKWKLWF